LFCIIKSKKSEENKIKFLLKLKQNIEMSFLSLLQLPFEIIILIFTEWLNIDDISKLDVAINNKAQRNLFLNYLNSNMFIFNEYEYKNLKNENYINWLIKRKIQVRKLNIEGKRLHSISNSRLIALIRMNSNLQSVELEDNYQKKKCLITNEIIKEIADNCKEIIELKVSNCELLNNIGYITISNDLLKIKKLNLSNSNEINDDSIINIAKNLTNLQDLNIYDCNKITDSSINMIAENLINLHYLNLFNCKKLTNIGLINVSKKLINLRYLNISNCKNITDDSIIKISENLTKLNMLILNGCILITDDSVIKIAEN
jgi:hypothetical protein